MMIQLFAVQTYERTRLVQTLFFTEWDDAQLAAVHDHTADGPGFDYTMITEFEVEEQALEEIRMSDTEALLEIMEKNFSTNLYYFT